MRTLRTHHRGYFFVWDLFDLWRSALSHVALEQLPTVKVPTVKVPTLKVPTP